MSDLFPLEIFPEGGLSSSVTTTVLIGVWVVAFFNLRYGWTLSALVVPGYLVPLLIVKPITACVIVLESLLTYFAARAVSEGVRYRGYWGSFFGRDRFFLILFLSVCIRLLFDGFLLPRLGVWLPAWRIDLHSFGLVAVPLIANYFWKPGAVRGMLHLQIIVSVTLFITRFVLIPYTNFRMSGLFYMYEDAAASMLSSPKSYILLISTAYLASMMNLRYGWEYSGILIPALLALEWNTPSKIVASLAEAGVILIGARLILSTPLLRGMTIEGARKIVLFFSVGYAWRLFLGFYLYAWLPNWQVSDVYGFGYLLSTLIAIKAHDRDATTRIAGAMLRLCGAGGVLGCIIGFALTFAPGPPEVFSEAAAPPSTTPLQTQFKRDLDTQIRTDKLRLYASARPGNFQPMSEAELNAFDEGLRALLQAESAEHSEAFNRGARWMISAGMEVVMVDSRYCCIREQEPFRRRGLYVLDLQATSDLVVAVPKPLSVPESLDIAVSLFHQQHARALLVGSDQPSRVVESSRQTAPPSHSCFAHAAHLTSAGNLLVVAGEDPAAPAFDRLSIKRRLPNGLNLKQLREILPRLSMSWGLSAADDPWLDEFWDGIAILNVSNSSRLSAAGSAFKDEKLDTCGLPRYDASLSRWLLDEKERIAVEGSEAYRPARLEEMLYLDIEVVTPLVRIASRAKSLSAIRGANVDRLRLASLAAATMNLQLAALVDDSTGIEYLILRDAPGPRNRHWGTIVFRLGSEFPAIFEVSRPLAELRTMEFGTMLFEASDGFGFLLSGAHLRANRDGSADLLQYTNKVSLMHLVRQVVLRMPQQTRLLFVQVRGTQHPFSSQAVFSPGTLVSFDDELPPLTRQLRECLQTQLGVKTLLNGTHPEAAGYTVSSLYAHLMRSQPATREVASLWLSEELRQKYRPVAESTLMEEQFLALDIPVLPDNLVDYLSSKSADHSSERTGDLPEESVRQHLKATLFDYVSREDILLLRKLQDEFADWDWLRLNDLQSGQPFLILSSPQSAYQLVVNLAPGVFDTVSEPRDEPTAENLRQFLRQRHRMIEFGRQP